MSEDDITDPAPSVQPTGTPDITAELRRQDGSPTAAELSGAVGALSPARVGRWGLAAFFSALSVLGLAYGAYFAAFRGQGCCDQAVWGQFGDFIGGVINPVLGLLTLLGLAVTVWLQMRQVDMGRMQLRLAHEQLALSRKELELTRRELERSATAQHMAAEALKGQLEQTRVAADAQAAAAMHQGNTAEAMREQAEYAKKAAQIQALAAALEGMGGTNGMNTGLVTAAVRRALMDKSLTNTYTQDLRVRTLAELLVLTAALTPDGEEEEPP